MSFILKMFTSKQTASDSIETASNSSDIPSDGSNFSSLSGLTGFEEELHDLKHLLKSNTIQSVKSRPENGYEVFETKIQALNEELHHAFKLNEKYKQDLSNLERGLELKFHDKFESLLRKNAQLEVQLSLASKKASEKHVLTQCKTGSELEIKYLQLEKEYSDANCNIQLLSSELEHRKKEIDVLETSQKQLKLETEELKAEMGGKVNTIEALKNKITDLHIEIQNVHQEKVKLNTKLLLTLNELDSLKKSERWYKEQLSESRKQNIESAKEIFRLQNAAATSQRELYLQKSNYNDLNTSLQKLKQELQQENQDLRNTITNLELNRKENIVAEKSKAFQEEPISKDYESTVQSLMRELSFIKQAVNEQQQTCEDINKENAELLGHNTVLQSALEEKEVLVANLETEKKDLRGQLDMLSERLKSNEAALLQITDEKSRCEITLSTIMWEKSEIEEAILVVRENFNKLIVNFTDCKNELSAKELLLKETVNQLNCCQTETRKTEQKIVDLEAVKANLEKELTAVKANSKSEMEKLNLNLSNEIHQLKELFLEENIIKEQLTIEKTSLQNFVSNLQDELAILKSNVRCSSKEIAVKNKLVATLEEDKRTLNRKLESQLHLNKGLAVKLKTSEEFFKVLKLEHDELKSKVNLEKKNAELNCEVRVKSNGFTQIPSYSEAENVLLIGKLRKKLKEVTILYKAKELEEKEKRNRYDTNNRTLMKKIKEHMRGRNTAEKHCLYLQDLYNKAVDELNTFKLNHSFQENEVESLRNLSDNYKNMCTKLEKELMQAEKELAVHKVTNGDCINYSAIEESLLFVDGKLKKSLQQVQEYSENLNVCHKKVHEHALQNEKLEKENDSLAKQVQQQILNIEGLNEKIVKLNLCLENEQESAAELQKKLVQKENEYLFCNTQLKSVQSTCHQIKERNRILCEEAEMLSEQLVSVNAQLQKLQTESVMREKSDLQKEEQISWLKNSLRLEMEGMQEELSRVQADRNFLQRLCNDLKLALHTSLRQSKVFQQKIESLQSPPSSLSLIDLPSPSKCDEEHISKLLQQSNAAIGKPLGNLQNSLNSLKKEMVSLRKQVSEKPGFNLLDVQY